MISLEAHLCSRIESILRPPCGILKHPFLVPGGIFHDELWDWDSYWITKGVLGMGDRLNTALRTAFLEHAIGSWENFFEHQSPNGSVPIMVKSDHPDFFGNIAGERTGKNQAKPIFAQFALAISQSTGDFTWLAPYFDSLLKFHDRWYTHYRSDCGLLVWGSDVAIGVDNDPATYGRPEFSSANLLLNCLCHRDLMAAAEIANALNRPVDEDKLRQRAKTLGSAIQKECWDDNDGFFYSVDVHCGDRRKRYLPGVKKGMAMSWKTLPLKVKMFTGFLPMWCGIATEEQAQILVEKHLRNQEEFYAPWGLRSMSKSERMYAPATDSANPSNWLGPVWIVASYMVYEALLRYGYHADASELAGKTHSLLETDLQKTGTIHECYHPDTGAPNFNADFLSWNLLAALMEEKSR